MIDAITIKVLSKIFDSNKVLSDISLNFKAGEMVALIGPSGSGKSTLLRHINGLTKANEGQVFIQQINAQTNGSLNKQIRKQRSRIGFVFQQFNLINRFSVIDNVLLGCLGRIPHWRGCCQFFTKEERAFALECLSRVSLEEYANRRASTLSGGQQQRVAIARTLMQQADIILADEPIASLDPESAKKVMSILADINKTDGKTVIVTLHQVDYARRFCPRTVALKQGEIQYDGLTKNLNDQFLTQLYGSELCALDAMFERHQEQSFSQQSCVAA